MDHQTDYERFRKLLLRLCATMSKPFNDELLESWWKALRAVRYAEVERRIESFLERATEATRFPRPSQMRPDDVPVADPKDEARNQRQIETNSRSWRDFIAEHPRTGPIRLAMAKCAQVMANTREDSPSYSEADYEYRALEKQLGPNGRFSVDA
jgi:hypothetical protein